MVKVVQAEVNIGLFGHVDHGKTTLVKQITGKWTDTHSEELKRGISIRIGYADVNIYYCENCKTFSTTKKCPCGGEGKLLRKISFVDSPGHESLMANAISASSIIDGVLFLIAANEEFPQEQTKEHLEIIKLIGVKNIVVIHTKLDLVSKEKALQQYKQIKEYMKEKLGFIPPIIPISATYKINIDKVLKAIQLFIPTPKREETGEFKAYSLRSFDVNKPGTKIEELKGGVIGGVIVRGKLSVGEEIAIFPGAAKQKSYQPLETKVVSLRTEEEELKEAKPGGLIAIGTLLDPAITKSDNLAGNIIVKKQSKDKVNVYSKIIISYKLLERKEFENIPLRQGEVLLINVNTLTTAGIISKLAKRKAFVVLKRPIAVFDGEKLAISRRIGNRWRLSAVGKIEGSF